MALLPPLYMLVGFVLLARVLGRDGAMLIPFWPLTAAALVIDHAG